MRARNFGAGLLLALWLPACSMVEIEHLDATNEPIKSADVTYSLPKTLLRLVVVEYADGHDIMGFAGTGSCTVAKLCSEILVVPDPDHSYAIRFKGSLLSDDTLKLTVNGQGFLTGADGLADDKTGDIIVAATKLAMGDYGGPRAFAGRGEPAFATELLVDPHDRRLMSMANRRLAEFGLAISCTGACGPSADPVYAKGEEIYYRHKRTIYLNVTDRSERTLKAVYPLPSFNGSPLIAHRLERSPFINRQTIIAYSDEGLPTSVEHRKPSEALGLVQAAGNVAAAVVAAPVNVFTQQTSQANAEATYLQARERLLQQQAAALEAASRRDQSAISGAVNAYADRRDPDPSENASKPPPSAEDIEGAGSVPIAPRAPPGDE